MTFEKWHPLTELEGMRREMNRIWQELIPSSKILTPVLIGQAGRAERAAARPPVDIIDKNEEVIIKADMPGVKKEDIDISLQDGTLVLRGEIKNEEGAPDDSFIYSGRNRDSYARSIDLPVKIDAANIRANLKDGVLCIHLPKARELQPKKINVEVYEGAKG